MKDLYHSFHSAVVELIGYLLLQGLFLIIFAVLALFYPYFLVVIVAFLLVCLAVLSVYSAVKVWLIKRKLDKLFG